MHRAPRPWPLAVVLFALASCVPENEPQTPRFLRAPDAGPASSAGADASPEDLAKDPAKLLARIDALKAELGGKPRDFQVNVALGSLFYDNGRYIEAIQYFTEAVTQAADAEARIVALRGTGAFPSQAAVPDTCRQDVPDDASKQVGLTTRSLDATVAAARALEPTDAASAASCWAQLVPPLALLHAKRGNAWYLIGNSAKSRADHDAALALDPLHPEALFFVGALTLELAKGDPVQLDAGKAHWQKLIDAHPDHPRAKLVADTLPRIHELFGKRPAAAPSNHPPVDGAAPAPATDVPAGPAPLPEGVADAMAKVERTPELDAQLDALLDKGDAHLAAQQWQEALDTFKQVMPLRPDGRVALGLGTALGRLGKPSAERVLEQAVRMPNGKPSRAKLELARVRAARDVNAAKALLAEIAADPDVGADAKALLATLP